MIPLPILLAIVTSAFLLGGSLGYKFTANHYTAKMSLQQAVAQQQYEKRVFEVDTIAGELEKVKNERQILSQAIADRLEVVIDRPVYRNVCIDDDGLRLLNDAIKGTPNPAKPVARVPAPPPFEER